MNTIPNILVEKTWSFGPAIFFFNIKSNFLLTLLWKNIGNSYVKSFLSPLKGND